MNHAQSFLNLLSVDDVSGGIKMEEFSNETGTKILNIRSKYLVLLFFLYLEPLLESNVVNL